MENSGERIGKRVRIILMGNFHYSGIVLSEDNDFIMIKDKFGSDVSLAKKRIEVLEVQNGE